MAPRPRTLTVAILSLVLSGFAVTSSALQSPPLHLRQTTIAPG